MSSTMKMPRPLPLLGIAPRRKIGSGGQSSRARSRLVGLTGIYVVCTVVHWAILRKGDQAASGVATVTKRSYVKGAF
jgi:hypothetical protein